MDVQQRLDDIVAAVESARSMPMSASCVVNRAELLDMLGEVREALPGSLAQAQELLGGREQLVDEARQEARRIIDGARAELGSLVSGTEVARRSEQEADRILAEARREAEEIRAQADDYVDSKLANFEVVLSKTIGSVDRGRDKLLGRAQDPAYGADRTEDAEDADLSVEVAPLDPETRRQRAEEYIEAQFRAFEAVLAKTLEAVGRGRQKLTGHRPSDELGAHMAAQDGQHEPDHQPRGSDADYLAGLAEDAPPAARGGERPAAQPAAPAPQQQPQPEPYAADYAQTGYQSEQSYAAQYGQGGYGQDGYGYGYQDPAGQQPDPLQQPSELGGYPAGQGAYGYGGGQGYQDPAGYPPGGQGYDPTAGQGTPYPPPQGYQGGYDGGQGGYPAPDPYAGQQQTGPDGRPAGYGQQPAALDETSLFDTSMIDMEQLRRYEQGR